MVRAKTAGLARRAEFGDSLRDELAGARSESSADGIDATPSQTEMLLSDRAQVNSLSSSQQAAQAAGVAPPVAVPLAFVDGGLMEALPEGQRPALDAVQREFAATMGDVGQDPASPAYLQRWQDARRIADQQFRNMFGEQAALQMERQANLQGDRGAARQ